MIMANDITWGDTVFVSESAPEACHPGSQGSVCGIRERTPPASGGVAGDSSRLYLIEFTNGESIEVPDEFVRKIEND